MAPEQATKQLRITFLKSGIGYSETQKRTLKALGLRRLGDVVTKDDSPSVRGMVAAVSHLIQVEEVSR